MLQQAEKQIEELETKRESWRQEVKYDLFSVAFRFGEA